MEDERTGGRRPLAESNPEAVDEATREEANPEVAAADTEKSYEEMTVDELQAEVDRRDFEVEGTGSDGNILKSDLVEALEEDDEENA